MGDPKKLKKRYWTPMHPWNKNAIEEQKKLRQEYGLQTRKEILIASSYLKKYKDNAKRLIALKSAQAEKEKQQMLHKLQKLGLLAAGAELPQILGLQVQDILNRRIQSITFRKGLARSMKQARQFITHRHILLGEKEITSPSYMASLEEEGMVRFKPASSLADETHPERVSVVEESQKAAGDKAGKESKEKAPKKGDEKKMTSEEDKSQPTPADVQADAKSEEAE
ncbi:30S ribosomal protein S4 [Candidatus Woesearchaeota archaeon]|nr:30S ribosomal protein S4 [Candidatus Woesearchaeota archaeon]